MEISLKVPRKYGKQNDTLGFSCHGWILIWLNRHLERARIVFAIESEMSTEERDSPKNKYWTNVDDERYLQVEEVDDKAFLGDDDEDEGEEDQKEEEEEKSEAVQTKL